MGSQCELYEDLLVQESLGEISEKERMFLKAHLDSCGQCRGRLAAIGDTVGILKREKGQSAPAGLAERTLRRVERAGERFTAAASPYHETVLTKPSSWKVRRSLVGWMVAASILVMAVASLVPDMMATGESRGVAVCQEHMQSLGTALRQYAMDHNGMYPQGADWYKKIDYQYLGRMGVLLCPGQPAVGPTSQREVDYAYNSTRVSVNEPSDYPLLWDKKGAHDLAGRNVLFADGSVRWVGEEEFEIILVRYKIDASLAL